MSQLQLNLLGTYATNIFNRSAAEIVVHDPQTQRLFIVNASAPAVEVLDISNPSNPTKLFEIDPSVYGATANSVAVSNGIVAVAIDNPVITEPGKVVFFDTNGQFLSAVTVGALPDMLLFTPDGTKVLVANEGEPNADYTIDPEGSVSIIDISGGVANLTQDNVITADFTAFNDQRDALIAAGVRIFGPNATVAQDLEPEYIAISGDSRTAYVALQENNAIAVLDIPSGTFTNIIPQGYKPHGAEIFTFDRTTLPPFNGTTTVEPASSGEILLGGLGGIFFEGFTDTGKLQLIGVPDRNPSSTRDTTGDGRTDARVFPFADAPTEIVRFELDRNNRKITVTERVQLFREDGITPVTRLPNIQGDDDGLTPIAPDGTLLEFDPYGADFEGFLRTPDGSYWLVDEYRPAIYHFNPLGILINRFVAEGTAERAGQPVGTFGLEVLPPEYLKRRDNRGFEGIAYQDGKIFAFTQSPLNNPSSRNSQVIRILELDIATSTTTGEYLYQLVGGQSDKIGDAVSLGEGTGEFLVIERDSDPGRDSIKNVFRITLEGATNLRTVDPAILPAGATFDSLPVSQLQALGINPVGKTLEVDLAKIGYDFVDKPEGLALIDAHTIAVLNDNDFETVYPLALGLIDLRSVNNPLDVSDRDGAINITNYPNLFGMYQPDAIALYEINGQTYIVTANEGDARDYRGFAEEARVKDLILDRDSFPNARELQRDQNLGRLTVTTANGISDGIFFRSTLTGAQEVTPVTTPARGNAVLKLNDDRTALSYELTITGLDFGPVLGLSPQTPDPSDDVTMLHFHQALRGANGPVVFGILNPDQDPDLSFSFNADGSTTLNGIWRESDPATKALSEFVPTLLNANIGDEVDLYFNVHTVGNRSGEIRGQLTSTLAYNELYVFGGRSFSIWDTEGNLAYDSGAEFEEFIAERFPDHFNSNHSTTDFDTRSDNKGPEPEGVAIGEIDGRIYAFIGQERFGGVFTYDITNPAEAFFVNYVNNRDVSLASNSGLAGDLGAEGIIFIPAADSPNGEPLVVVANEVSGTTSLFSVTPPPFTLQLFHFADQEAGASAFTDIPRLSAVLNALKAEDLDNDGIPGFPNTLVLSSGDAYIPGLFFNASQIVYGGLGRGDILIQNALGVQAIALGNHEFDAGTGVLRDLIAGDNASFPGTAFPYLSSNLDFSTDPNLADLVVADAQAPLPNSIAASVVFDVNGEKIGVVGSTTPTLRIISNPGGVTVTPQPFDVNPTPSQLDALAAEIQSDVDVLLATNPDVDKVILLAHMQQLGIELELATRLRSVDIIVTGGSNTRLVDENDRLRVGDTEQGNYPLFTTDADGNPVAVVSTDGNYKYLGRLVVDFDHNGVIIPDSYNPNVGGSYATDAQGVADLGGLVNPEIQAIVDSLQDVVVQQESNFFGVSSVYLNGDRNSVRRQETNLGNLTADANLAIARDFDPDVVISFKNGGGIRNSIGRVVVPTGAGMFVTLPNEAVIDGNGNIVKPEGGVSQNDIANALSFNNGLTLVTLTAAQLLAIAEHGVASITSNDTTSPGSFPQISGFSFSFDLTREPGDRVRSLAIEDETGKDLDVVVRAGEVVGDPNRTFRMVTLNFLAGGGDGYPFPQGESANQLVLAGDAGVPPTGNATFAPDGTEQDALAEYLFRNFLTTPFGQADTSRDLDTRLQNLAFRTDTVIDPVSELVSVINGSPSADDLILTSTQSGITVFTGDGDDQVDGSQSVSSAIYGGTGNDTILVGSDSYASGGDGDDTLMIGAQGPARGSVLDGGRGQDTLMVVEADGGNILLGGADHDTLQVAEGRGQMLFGGSAPDVLRSSPDGHNRLYGGSGDDQLFSTVGDRLFGGDGNDSLYAGQGGNNFLWGGQGADNFWLVVGGSLPDVPNVLKDFELGIDRIGMGGITANQVSL
ncbi:esterase-like activity of phytase family protein, partial [Anabaenopsis sp. FSS-46]|uniref:choice-of-anchor I domain-containing protein n=1 Tax=Anabaenopsis sp. FSS-46 TaxID=2971766 RepID=UPI0024750D9C